MYRYSPLVLILLALTLATGCRKEIRTDSRLRLLSPTKSGVTVRAQLATSCSEVTLLSGNAKSTALRFNWPAFAGDGNGETYLLEIDIAGAQFSDPIEVGSTCTRTMEFTGMEINELLRRKSLPGTQASFEFRIRMKNGFALPVYSDPVTIQVTTYDVVKEYPISSMMFVPGNFQNWELPSKNWLISGKGNDTYEGFINMPIDTPKFLFVKYAENKKDFTVFYNIGNGKIGMGLNSFDLTNSGIYKLTMSTSTKQWDCTRIENFNVYGEATGMTDVAMEYDQHMQGWNTTADLTPGTFYFRANRSDTVRLGTDAAAGSLRSNGEAIRIKTAGRYRITLSVLTPGNYKYGLQQLF